MTSAISGMEGSIWVCDTVGGTYLKLAELSDLKLKIAGQDIDTSNVDDAGWGSSIQGARSWEVTLANNLIMADDAYELMIAAAIAGTSLFFKILQDGTASATPKGWAGEGGVSSTNLTLAGPKTQQKADWTIKGRGALAVAT